MSKIKWLNCRQVLQGVHVSLEFSSGQTAICLVICPIDILGDLFNTIPYVFKSLISSNSTLAPGFAVCPSQTSKRSGTMLLKGSWRNVLWREWLFRSLKVALTLLVWINSTVSEFDEEKKHHNLLWQHVCCDFCSVWTQQGEWQVEGISQPSSINQK